MAIMKADLWAGKTDEWSSSMWKPPYDDRYDSELILVGLSIDGFPVRLLSRGTFDFFVPVIIRGYLIESGYRDEITSRVMNGLTKSQPATMHSSLSQVNIRAPRSQADFVNMIDVNEIR